MVARKKDPPPAPMLVRADRLQQLRARGLLQLRLIVDNTPSGPYGPAQILANCGDSFLAFLPWWKFKVRDVVGRNQPVRAFDELWRGQHALAELMDDRHDPRYQNGPWIFALKAGKLGFSELECAYDAYVARFRGPNTRVHIFSRDLEASKEMLKIVRFGLTHLPPWFGVRLARRSEPGGDNTTSLRFRVGIDDERVIKSYATGEHIGVDQSCHHAHVDEWAHMLHKKEVWENVQTTVAQDGGSLHIVTRGAGDDATVRETWDAAVAGTSELRPFFSPWQGRDNRDAEWLEREARKNTVVGLQHFAPETPEEALMGDEANDFLPILSWDACLDPGLAPLMPGDQGDPLVAAVDAAITGDSFAIVVVSRHPDHPNPCGRSHGDPAVRAVKVWKPEQFAGGRINFRVAEGWLRTLCEGGCPGDPTAGIEAHPLYAPGGSTPPEWSRRQDCAACVAGATILRHNVFKVVYDKFQLEDMMQRFRQDGVVTVGEFDQGSDRLVADAGLRALVIQRRLAHNGDRTLREHIENARAKLQANEDSKLRIIKKDAKRRVDAAVAASMATDEVLRLYL